VHTYIHTPYIHTVHTYKAVVAVVLLLLVVVAVVAAVVLVLVVVSTNHLAQNLEKTKLFPNLTMNKQYMSMSILGTQL